MRWRTGAGWGGGGWVAQAQLVAITVLGMVVLIPFAMAAGVVMLAAAIVLIGPIGLMQLVRRDAARDPAAAGHGGAPPTAPEP